MSEQFPAWIGSKAIEFDAKGLQILRNPGVYIYVRGDRAVYVGASHSVIGRALHRNHHIKKELFEGASLLIFPCETFEQAKELEKKLTSDLKPVYNQRNLYSPKDLAQKLDITQASADRLSKDLQCQRIQKE